MTTYHHRSEKFAPILLLLFFAPALLLSQITAPEGSEFRAAPETTQSKLFQSTAGDRFWSITPNDGAMTLSVGPGTPATEVVVSYSPLASSGSCPASTAYTLAASPIGPGSSATLPITACKQVSESVIRPIEVIMVVDVSGSMGDPAVCQCDAVPHSGSEQCQNNPQSGTTKLMYLKEKLLATFNTLKTFMQADAANKMALVTFNSSANVAINLKAFNNATLTTEMNTLMGNGSGSLQPQGATAMGAGLQTGFSQFSPPDGDGNPNNDPIKVVLLFTNGIQNVSPMVSVSGGNVLIGGSAIPPGVKIIPYAIFTPESTYASLLKAIAESGGVATNTELSTSPYICAINRPLRQNWVNAVESLGSPKLVHFSNGNLSGNSAQETFTVTENMDRISIAVSSVGSHNYSQMKVERIDNGTPVDLSGVAGQFIPPLNVPSQHRVYTVTFPVNGISVTAQGEYRVSFTANQPNLGYDLSAIVDDRGLKQYFFNSPVVAAGEELFLGTRLRQNGTPVENSSVTATIYRSKKRLGNSFAQTKVPGAFIDVKGPWGRLFPAKPIQHDGVALSVSVANYKFGGRDGAYIKQISINHPTLASFKGDENIRMAIGEKKHIVLLNETNYRDFFAVDPIAVVPLNHDGDGVYRATYKGTGETGLYHVRFEAKGSTALTGPYYRVEDKTALVRFGTPDKKKSCLIVLYESPYILMMKPVDTEGNLLGPNETNAISIVMSEGSAANWVDYLDGRYVVPLSVADNADPNIQIRIHGRLLYDGPLSGIQQKRGFFSLHGGLTFPQGNFGNSFEGGYYGEAKLGYRVYREFGLQIKGGYYAFKNTLTNKTDYSIFGIGGGVTYRKWLGFNFLTGVYLQAESNIGYYKPENGDGVFGANGGLSLMKPVSHFVNIVLSSDYHYLSTDPENVHFLTAGLGVQFRF
ncbi:MAG: vWA domain-containing protein [Saprospiraceae bacterium]